MQDLVALGIVALIAVIMASKIKHAIKLACALGVILLLVFIVPRLGFF